MMHALIASGTGRYADPWHPYPRTSAEIAAILKAAGFKVAIRSDVDDALASLDGVDLLVVNAGDPWRSDAPFSPPPPASVTGLAEGLRRGIGILAMHASLASLRDYPDWAEATGAVWLPGVSYHPPADEALITGTTFPDGAPVGDFAVFDERYCRLQPIGDRYVVATHSSDTSEEPAAWVRTHGLSRVAVDLLGHDENSFTSIGHRNLVRRLAEWAVSAHK